MDYTDLIEEMIDKLIEGESLDEVFRSWRKKTASQLMKIRRQRKRRKFKVKNPKRSRIMKRAMRKWARSKSNVMRAARRRSRY